MAAPAQQELTRELASYATRARFADLPGNVQVEAARAFLNWMGCAFGGSQESAVQLAAASVADLGGGPQASIIGHAQRTDVASAAFVNCIASSVQAFDDAHLATVTHPSGPVAAALFALSERRSLTGERFLNALALGIEVTCRVSNMLVLPPAQFNVGFYVTGLSAPIGVAAAVGNVIGLTEQQMNWAIGLAASQSSGFRATHGTMTAHFRPGHAARCGVWAALMAAKGFTGDEFALEADKGFVDVYAPHASPDHAVKDLGRHFELLTNTYKPYPCGIVIHPVLDGCLEVHRQMGTAKTPVTLVSPVAAVTLRVHPLVLKLTGVRTPRTTLESHVSVYHCAAAALMRGTLGLEEVQQDCIDDVDIASLRERIETVVDDSVGRDQAVVEVRLADGRTLHAHVTQARGSLARPMTDEELDSKFRSQALRVLAASQADQLLDACRGAASLHDVGHQISSIWSPVGMGHRDG